jgi:hypothetical protein
MSKWTNRRWIGRTSRKAGEALRFCLALYLMLQIVCTSIHIYLEPHSDLVDSGSTEKAALVTVVMGDDGHDDDSDHERHPVTHHDLKALRTQRAPVAELVMTVIVAWVPAENDCPEPQAFEFSGLSPPEFTRSWQFLFRAALPVRAPSLLS